MNNPKLVCVWSEALLQDWITSEALALEDGSWIMNKISQEKYVCLLRHLSKSCTTPTILMLIVALIFNKAILEPTFCPMYAKLCYDIDQKLPTFTDNEAQRITFKRMLLNRCQEAFEKGVTVSDEVREMNTANNKVESKYKNIFSNLRARGNLRFIGELVKLKMVTIKIAHSIVLKLMGDDEEMCPTHENVEALCLFLKTIGKELDGSMGSKKINDIYFNHLKKLANNHELVMRSRYLIRDIISFRNNGWVSKQEVGGETSKYGFGEIDVSLSAIEARLFIKACED